MVGLGTLDGTFWGMLTGLLFEAAAPSAAELTITKPVNLPVLKISEPILVMDIGGGLPEGHIVVQAVDAEGTVLAKESTGQSQQRWKREIHSPAEVPERSAQRLER